MVTVVLRHRVGDVGFWAPKYPNTQKCKQEHHVAVKDDVRHDNEDTSDRSIKQIFSEKMIEKVDEVAHGYRAPDCDEQNGKRRDRWTRVLIQRANDNHCDRKGNRGDHASDTEHCKMMKV